jgi:hypothetical protein
MRLNTISTLLVAFMFSAFVPVCGLAAKDTRSITIDKQEITRPDGDWLIFTALSHLFRLPINGGTA